MRVKTIKILEKAKQFMIVSQASWEGRPLHSLGLRKEANGFKYKAFKKMRLIDQNSLD